MPLDGSDEIVKIYFRTPSKHAKVLHLPMRVSTDELYLFAAQNYNIPIENIHLFYQGIVLPTSTSVILSNNSIIHIVKLQELKKQKISINLKVIGRQQIVRRFEIKSNLLVSSFIEKDVGQALKVRSQEIILVHLGKQLKLTNTFLQEEIEDGSELLCVIQACPAVIPNDNQYTIKVGLKDIETPQPPKDIYPKSDFAINVPQEVDTKNHLQLIFDSKIRHSSSIQNIDLDPSEIIHEQDSNFSSDINHGHHSCHSEHGNQNKTRQSHYSEDGRIGNSKQLPNLETEGMELKEGDLIYAGDFHILREKNPMNELIQAYKQRLKFKFQKE